MDARRAAVTARLPAGSHTAPATTRKVITPDPTSSHSIGTTSASGPKITIPNGIATAITMPTKPNTRPCRSGSTVSCSSVIDGVEKNGTPRPTRNMKPKNSQMLGERPSPIDRAPNTSDEAMIMPMRLRLAKNDATTMPPSTIPTLKEISSTARFTTFCCSPASNVRTSISGVRLDGATMSTKMIANSTSSQRTNAWCAT